MCYPSGAAIEPGRRPSPGTSVADGRTGCGQRVREEANISSLAKVPLFQKLSAEELKQLEGLAQRKRFPSGSAVFFQDDPSDSLYVVLSGSVKVFQSSEDGKDQVLNTMGAGEAFGELAMIEGRPRTATVQSLQDTELLVLSRKDFETFAEQHPKVLWKLLQALSERVRQYMESTLDLAFRDVPYRLLRVLQQLLQRHGVAEGDGRRIGLSLSLGDLASMVGATPDTVGRLLERYEKDGLLRRAGESWLVPDPRALDKALEYAGQ